MDLDASLIEEVKIQPVLYDPNDPMYKDVELKRKIWLEIGRKILDNQDETTTVSALKVRWKSLRDSYVKERKYDLSQSYGVTVKPKKPWRLKKQMEFLAPYIQIRKEFSNSLAETEVTVLEKSSQKGEKSDRTFTFSTSKSKPMHETNSPMKFETNLFNQSISTSNNQRFIEIDSFFRDIANAVKGLNRKSQLLVEKDITQLVMDYKLKELEEEEEK